MILGAPDNAPPLVPVATNLHLPVRVAPPHNLSESAVLTTRMRHRMQRDASGLRLAFGSWYDDLGEVRRAPAELQVSVFIELDAVGIDPAGRVGVTFDGLDHVRIPPGDAALSDPVPFDLASDRSFFSITTAVAVDGTRLPVGSQTNALDGEGVTAGGPDRPIAPSTAYGYGPHQILGTPRSDEAHPPVVVMGDSNAVGYGDVRGQARHFGWVRRAFDAATPVVNLAVSGITATGSLAPEARARQAALLRWVRPQLAISALGTNDLQQGGPDLTAMQRVLTARWGDLTAAGMDVIACTLPPVTSSSNRWQNTADQIPTPGWRTREQVNAWLRSQPKPLVGVLDLARVVAESSHPHVWKPGFTDDGIHLNTAGHGAVADHISKALAASRSQSLHHRP